MVAYNLTERQRELLRILVNGCRNEGWGETFMDVSTFGGYSLVSMQGGGSIDIEDIDDMNVIAATGLLLKQTSHKGTARYTLTQAAFEAVENGFKVPDQPSSGNQYIGVQVHGSVGGPIQGIGYADKAQIEQILGDPEALRQELENILSQLLDALKNDLQGDQLLAYLRQAEELKAVLASERPDKSNLKRLIEGLAFANDTSSSLELMAKAWPYVGALLQLAASLLGG